MVSDPSALVCHTGRLCPATPKPVRRARIKRITITVHVRVAFILFQHHEARRRKCDTMAPVLNADFQQIKKRVPMPSTQVNPPTRESMTTEGGFLEAWAQGYNVGSLIILILIVFCNYRSGILLHKLILLEVRSLAHRNQQTRNMARYKASYECTLTVIARPGSLARHLHIHSRPRLWMVPLLYGYSPLRLLPTPQRCIVVKDTAVPPPPRLPHLHCHPHPCPTLLDRRGLVQLQLLQRTRV